jgi:nucleotide-binding universal stress UspA family protein
MFERIVVGLDGSKVSEVALRQGAELARRLDVPLHLIRVADLSVVRWGATEAAEAYAALSDEMRRPPRPAALVHRQRRGRGRPPLARTRSDCAGGLAVDLRHGV